MHHLYEQFRQLIADPPRRAGTVVGIGTGSVTVALPGGSLIHSRGSASVVPKVFVRDDVIEGGAPAWRWKSSKSETYLPDHP